MRTILTLLTVLTLTGCATLDRIRDLIPEIPERPAPEQPANEFPPGVRWLHADVSGWPVTTQITSVTFSSGQIRFPFDAANRWTVRTDAGTTTPVIGNPWIVFEYQGQWYAGTWEWLRPGQTSKPMRVVDGAHIKRAPIPTSWRPKSGQRVGIMVSTHARSRVFDRERSNLVWTVWP